MKTKVILKTLLDIMLFIAGAVLLEAILKFLMVYINGFPNYFVDKETLANNPFKVKSLIVLNVFNQALFFSCILFLRRIAKIYRDEKSFYQLKILGYLKVSGWCLLFFSGLEIVIRTLEILITPNTFQLAGITSTQKSALLAVLAILMIRLSKIFKKTVEANQENEFTI